MGLLGKSWQMPAVTIAFNAQALTIGVSARKVKYLAPNKLGQQSVTVRRTKMVIHECYGDMPQRGGGSGTVGVRVDRGVDLVS